EPRVVMRPRHRGHRLEPAPRLRKMAVLLPEPPHRERETDRDRRVRSRERPVEDGPDVVVLELETLEPAALIVTRQLGCRALDEGHVPVTMAPPDHLRFAARLEMLRRVLADGVEQAEPDLAARRLVGLYETLVGQCSHGIDDVAADLR